MEIVWEIARHALSLAICIPILLIGILWLWTSTDVFGRLQLSFYPLIFGVGISQGLFGIVGGITAVIVFTPVFVWIVRRIV